MKIRNLALAALAALPLAACHSCPDTEARFWSVRDGAGRRAFTVDTVNVGYETIPAKYVAASGNFAAIDDPVEKSPMSEGEWRAATNGAGWTLHYGPVRKACWASVSER